MCFNSYRVALYLLCKCGSVTFIHSALQTDSVSPSSAPGKTFSRIEISNENVSDDWWSSNVQSLFLSENSFFFPCCDLSLFCKTQTSVGKLYRSRTHSVVIVSPALSPSVIRADIRLPAGFMTDGGNKEQIGTFICWFILVFYFIIDYFGWFSLPCRLLLRGWRNGPWHLMWKNI